MAKFTQTFCEVCHEPIGDVTALPPEIQAKVYKPGADESYNVEVDLNENGREVFGEEIDEFDQ